MLYLSQLRSDTQGYGLRPGPSLQAKEIVTGRQDFQGNLPGSAVEWECHQFLAIALIHRKGYRGFCFPVKGYVVAGRIRVQEVFLKRIGKRWPERQGLLESVGA